MSQLSSWGSGLEVSIGMQVGKLLQNSPIFGPFLGPTRAEEGPTLALSRIRGRVPSTYKSMAAQTQST